MRYSREQIKYLAEKTSEYINTGDYKMAVCAIKPVLDSKCPFLKLDLLGREIGESSGSKPGNFFNFLDSVVDYNAMGGFVVAGQALIKFLPYDLNKVMEKSREYIIKGDRWYVCDIIGERSIGYSLVEYFEETLPWLEKFLRDENRWVKRSAGVAVHFFSKRVLNEPDKTKKILDLIEPFIEEKQSDAVKGIGWGLKTIGKHHPDILAEFLKKQIKAKNKISKLMMRKALTYLKKDKRSEVENYV